MGKTIKLNESQINEIADATRMTEYKFYNNIQRFLSDLLLDPVGAKVPFLLQANNIERNGLLKHLKDQGIINRHQKISDRDTMGNPKTAKMIIKYSVPKKDFAKKMKKLFIAMIKSNVPEKIEKELLSEGRQSKNVALAKHFLYQKYGYDEAKAMNYIGEVKELVPNSRLAQYKFLLGVVRMYSEYQLNGGREAEQLNKTLKFVADGEHINEYDNNLNGLHVEELVERFKGIAATALKKDRQELSQMQFKPSDYTIVRIPTFQDAEKYGMYTEWCVANSENAYNNYTSNGSGIFYFCLKNGFEDVRPEVKEGCPLDEYGLSMIAVSVDEDGACNTVTCRWNHNNKGNDHIMSPKEVSQVIGYDFYQVFKPYTKEELRAKGIIPTQDIPMLLAHGADPNQIFTSIDETEAGLSRVIVNGKCNLMRPDHTLCFPEQWFDNMGLFYDKGPAWVRYRNKFNFINFDGKILCPQIWFNDIRNFYKGYAVVNCDEKWNVIDYNGNILSNHLWFDDISDLWGEIFAVDLNGKTNFLKRNGQLVSPQMWFDVISDDTYNEGMVLCTANENVFFVDLEGNLYDRQKKPISTMNECDGGAPAGTTNAQSSGAINGQPLFSMIRGKMPTEIDETTTASSVTPNADTSMGLAFPFGADKETADRTPGFSVERQDENCVNKLHYTSKKR